MWARGHGDLAVSPGNGPVQRRINDGVMDIVLPEGDYDESVVIPYNWMGRIRGEGGWFNTRIRAPWYVDAGSQPTLEGLTFLGAPLWWVSGYLGILRDMVFHGPGASLNVGLLPQGGRPAPFPNSWPTSKYPSALQLSNVYVGGDADHVRILASDVHWHGGSCERAREGLWWSTFGDFGVGSIRSVRFESDETMPLTLSAADSVWVSDCFLAETHLTIDRYCSPATGHERLHLVGGSRIVDEREGGG